MKRLCTILVACLLAAGLAACGDTGVLLAPDSPRYQSDRDRVDSGGRVTRKDTATAAPSSTEVTTEETTTERGGGYTAGSGG